MRSGLEPGFFSRESRLADKWIVFLLCEGLLGGGRGESRLRAKEMEAKRGKMGKHSRAAGEGQLRSLGNWRSSRDARP